MFVFLVFMHLCELVYLYVSVHFIHVWALSEST